MPKTADYLKWATLTRTVNEAKSPNKFVKKLLFSDHEPVATEQIEIGILDGDREIAPFVTRNGEAISVGGAGERFQNVEAPNIRIKRPLPPNDALANRRPGTVIFQTKQGVRSAAAKYIARQLGRLNDYVTNAEEYMCCMALRGQISYQADDDASFQITYPKPAGNTVDLGGAGYWTAGTSAPELDIHRAKRVVSEEVGMGVTDCILGTEAAEAFLMNAAIRSILDNRDVFAGQMDLTTKYSDDGVIFLGRFCGVNFWEYPRTVSVGGVSTDLIRPKYAEFIARGRNAEFKMYYAAIHDWDAFDQGRFVGEKFSKSWVQKDPSVRNLLVHSRPLPVPRRPGAIYSVQVVA